MYNKIQQIFLSAFEAFTGFLSIITSDHRYIHEGKGFSTVINTGSISGVYYIGITTPAASSAYIHYRPALVSSTADQVTLVMYEALTYTGGTAVTPFNRNRNSANTSMVTVAKGVTATPGSELVIDSASFGTAGNPVSRSGGDVSAERENILKPETKYIIALTPAGATTAIANLFWYEEPLG